MNNQRIILIIASPFLIAAFWLASILPAQAVNMNAHNSDAFGDNRWIRCVYDGSGYIDIGPGQTKVLPLGGRKCWVPAYTEVRKKYVGDSHYTTYGSRWNNSTGVWGPVFPWASSIQFAVDDKVNGVG